MAKRKKIEERNQEIKKEYETMKAERKYALDYIFKKLAEKYFLEVNTVQKIVYTTDSKN